MPRATGRLIPRRRRFVAVDEVGDIQTLALGLTRSLDSNLPGDEQAISGRSYGDYMLFRISLVRNFGASHVREMALCSLFCHQVTLIRTDIFIWIRENL